MPFTKFHSVTIDGGRFKLPKPILEVYKESFGDQGNIWQICKGKGSAIAIVPPSEFDGVVERMVKQRPEKENAIRRAILYSNTQTEMDGVGRMKISQPLLEIAAISKEAMLVGLDNYLELMSFENWKKYLTKSIEEDED
ncbi:hypothetical protein JXA32_13980 [Candidatus Sumerlaeota bacterium]|nr:hypothetical protein [Candidatus Sumerlaeota bacterium]